MHDIGNEMGNSNASGLQEQENREAQATEHSPEAVKLSNAADGVEDKLSDSQTANDGFHEKLKESAPVDASETSDHQIQELMEKVKEDAKLHPPNKSLETSMASNDEDSDKNFSALSLEQRDFLEKPIKASEIGAIDQKLPSSPVEAEDFHEKPIGPCKIGEQSENQTLIEEETKTSKQTSTTCETITMESTNQETIEQEYSPCSSKSCEESSSHENIIEFDRSCGSNQKSDSRDILDEFIDPCSDLRVVKNEKNMLIEETEGHKGEVVDMICISEQCYENFFKGKGVNSMCSVSVVQSGGLENGHEEQKTELNLLRKDSTKSPSISSCNSSYQEAIEGEIKMVCLEDYIEVIENVYAIGSNENNQEPTLISKRSNKSVDESKTSENGGRTHHGDKKEGPINGYGLCSSGIGRGLEVNEANEIESGFEIELYNSSPSLDIEEHKKDMEKDKEVIEVTTSLADNDTGTNLNEKMKVRDDESCEESKLSDSDETEGTEVTKHSLSLSDSIQKDVDIIEISRNTQNIESLCTIVEQTTEQIDRESDNQMKIDRESDNQMKEHVLKTSVTGRLEEVVQPIFLQSDTTQKNKIVEEETNESIIIQSYAIQKETIVEEKLAEQTWAESDEMQQERTLVQKYLVSHDHSQETEQERTLSEFGKSNTHSEEENHTKVDHPKTFDAHSSNPTVDTSVLAPELEDLMSQASIQALEISSWGSGELFVLPMHQINGQEHKCSLVTLEGGHDPNMAPKMPENCDTFSFNFENPFVEAQALALQSQEERQSQSLHLRIETTKGVASASENGLPEPDRKNLNLLAEVMKTEVSTLEAKIEKSEMHQLQQQPNENFCSKLHNPVAENRITAPTARKEESAEATMLILETSAHSKVFSMERSDDRKLTNPIPRILKEETCVLESQKQQRIVLKETVCKTWKSPKKMTTTSPGERKRHKPRYSFFGNCMCCTTVIQ